MNARSSSIPRPTITGLIVTFILASQGAFAQQVTRHVYYDKEKKNIKEMYQVKDTISNILQGRYISYYLNGNVESRGQFSNNETTGVWEFYYETGNLRMRGILRQNANYGLWEYFYENGVKSMEGTINDRKREGIWKIYYESGELRELGAYAGDKRTGTWSTFYEDGTKRGEIDYEDDHGRYSEFFRSGKVMAEGPRVGARNVGRWKTFREDGTVESEGDYTQGKRSGTWTYYYPNGKVASVGSFDGDQQTGEWVYYYENGNVSSRGSFVSGQRDGAWVSLHQDGSKKSEVTYVDGTGEYREYYPNGKLKAKGLIIKGKNQGTWQYYYQDGKLEGQCDFDQGKGTYYGYYPNGSLQTKGLIEDDLRVGTWELYEQDGKLSGYYKPFYEDKELASAINALVQRSKVPIPQRKPVRRRFDYFSPRYPEYRSVILQGNPAFMFVGSVPLGVEFYNEARLGHEFSFEALRDPFFLADNQVQVGKLYERGYNIGLKQKFYNPVKWGMWYFAHEIRFTNLIHYVNIQLSPTQGGLITTSANDQRVEYGVMGGVRLMEKINKNGFTLDAFVGYGLGYRNVSIDDQFQQNFTSLDRSRFVQTFRFGINFGYSFSFEEYR